MTRYSLALLALFVVPIACGDARSERTIMCVDDALEPCDCALGQAFRRCEGGTFGACQCGMDAGTLADAAFDAATPGCIPSCGVRECGVEPVCGTSCGSCMIGVCVDNLCETTNPGGPQILSWAVSSMTLTPSRTIMISVVLTDPDGVDDLIGGTLLDLDGAAYGSFSTEASEGSYSLTLNWSGVNDVSPITGGGGLTRSLVARFFDVAGNRIDRVFDISLACVDAGETPCSGLCVDLSEHLHHCGTCDFSCVAPGSVDTTNDRCTAGRCLARTSLENTPGTCAEQCASFGHVCDPTIIPPVPNPVPVGVDPERLGTAWYGECSVEVERCDQVMSATTECAGSSFQLVQSRCACWRDDPWDG